MRRIQNFLDEVTYVRCIMGFVQVENPIKNLVFSTTTLVFKTFIFPARNKRETDSEIVARAQSLVGHMTKARHACWLPDAP